MVSAFEQRIATTNEKHSLVRFFRQAPQKVVKRVALIGCVGSLDTDCRTLRCTVFGSLSGHLKSAPKCKCLYVAGASGQPDQEASKITGFD